MNIYRRAGPCRLGFTLIQLLVVIGVTALLIAILLPAVQRSREAGRRIGCVNNLKQIGLALQNYHSQFNMFPSAHYSDHDDGGAQNYFSPFVQLLPMLGQQELFNQFNFYFRFPVEDSVSRRNLPVFLCPSDPFIFAERGNNNYRVNLGAGPYWQPPGHGWPEGGDGAFQGTKWLRAADITDGLSHTVGVSEKIRGDDNDARFFPSGDCWLTGIMVLPFPDGEALRSICSALVPGSVPHDSNGGSSWAQYGYPFTWYNHVTTPNNREVPDCAVQFKGAPDSLRPGGIYAARSFHPGGVNCTMMDGSVRFINENIDLETWKALGTRNGGELSSLGGF